MFLDRSGEIPGPLLSREDGRKHIEEQALQVGGATAIRSGSVCPAAWWVFHDEVGPEAVPAAILYEEPVKRKFRELVKEIKLLQDRYVG